MSAKTKEKLIAFSVAVLAVVVGVVTYTYAVQPLWAKAQAKLAAEK